MFEGYFYIILSTVFGAFGGFFIKRTMLKNKSLFDAFRSISLFIGIGFYVIGVIFNIFALQVLLYVIVVPCSSITYIWSMIIAKGFLKENIGSMKVIGLALILLGVIFVAMN